MCVHVHRRLAEEEERAAESARVSAASEERLKAQVQAGVEAASTLRDQLSEACVHMHVYIRSMLDCLRHVYTCMYTYAP